MKFSVCTPVTYDRDNADELRMPRYKMFQRTINSVIAQTIGAKDFEWVIADDKCNPPLKDDIKIRAYSSSINIVELPEKSGRLIARNAAMKEAKGEWICWLDADDELSNVYLEALNDAIRLYPDFKVFNFNHLIFNYDYSTYVRKFINMEVQKDLPFPSGTVGAGSFIFHRSVMEDIGYLPELGLWQFADKAFEEFPEIKPFYEKKDQPGQYNSLGNPWGEDWYYFYKMTRKYQAKYLDTTLYYVHSRWGHRWKDDPNYVVDPGKKPELNPNNI